MDVDEFETKLRALRRAGKIDGSETLAVRNPDVTEGAMSAGSDGYHEAEEVLVDTDSDRLILLGEVF